jgi:hypothetical protein
MATFEGGCHCGRVRMRVKGDLDETVECNCSMCTKKGFLHLIVPRDRFELLAGRDDRGRPWADPAQAVRRKKLGKGRRGSQRGPKR